ncbi:N/A [soil metagenome]
MRQRSVTIVDVARAAKVSPATVSRVLNDSHVVSVGVASRVREEADRLGYRPNPTAQSLVRGRTGTVAVIVPDLANPFFSEILKSMAAAAAADDHRVLVADANEEPEEELRLVRELFRWVDGLLLCSPRMSSEHLFRVAQVGTPVVCTNRLSAGMALPTVTIDSHRGMLELCGHLAELGHRRLAYLAGPERSWSDGERRRALEAMLHFGFEISVVPCGSSSEDGFDAVPAALERRPSAVMCFNDLVALGALARLREDSIEVPTELSITGFDDIPVANFVSPGLTSVRLPKGALGRSAWRMLAALLRGESIVEPETIGPELVVRRSTGPPAVLTGARPPPPAV